MSKPPNLLIVFPDQMRGSSMGFLGEEPVQTPALDQFAAQSAVLTDAAANFPVCSPWRAMFLTGKYPHANGVVGNVTSRSGLELDASEACFTDILKRSGYRTGCIGKWHLDLPREPFIPAATTKAG